MRRPGVEPATSRLQVQHSTATLPNHQKPMKMLGIVAVGVVRESRKFSGHPYVGRIARSSLRQHSFLVTVIIALLAVHVAWTIHWFF